MHGADEAGDEAVALQRRQRIAGERVVGVIDVIAAVVVAAQPVDIIGDALLDHLRQVVRRRRDGEGISRGRRRLGKSRDLRRPARAARPRRPKPSAPRTGSSHGRRRRAAASNARARRCAAAGSCGARPEAEQPLSLIVAQQRPPLAADQRHRGAGPHGADGGGVQAARLKHRNHRRRRLRARPTTESRSSETSSTSAAARRPAAA